MHVNPLKSTTIFPIWAIWDTSDYQYYCEIFVTISQTICKKWRKGLMRNPNVLTVSLKSSNTIFEELMERIEPPEFRTAVGKHTNTWKSDKHVHGTAVDGNADTDCATHGMCKHTAKRNSKEPPVVMPTSSDLRESWESNRPKRPSAYHQNLEQRSGSDRNADYSPSIRSIHSIQKRYC